MSDNLDHAEEIGPIGDDLQFDRAEFDEAGESPGALACTACKEPIHDAYYEVAGQVVCAGCRDRIQEHFKGGAKLTRLLRATAYGTLAAVGGFAIYFGVAKVTGMEIGLISVLVGFMVGGAVLKGSGGRGGWVYQLLAIFLTYSAIVGSYTAMVIPELVAVVMSRPHPARQDGAKADPARKDAPGGAPKADPEAPVEGDAEEEEAVANKPPLSPGQFVIAILAVSLFFYAVPIYAGFSQPIGLLIIGFALWEAWKINKRRMLAINGPFAVGAGAGKHDAGAEGIESYA